MPDEDEQFGDLADQLKQTEEEQSADGEPKGSREGGESGEDDSQAQTDESTASEREPVDDTEDEQDAPAFSFDETDMEGFYIREQTEADIQQLESRVDAICSLFGVPGIEGREFDDACLQVTTSHADEVVYQIFQERGLDPDRQRISEFIEMLDEQEIDR
jgi:hypothetical protein